MNPAIASDLSSVGCYGFIALRTMLVSCRFVGAWESPERQAVDGKNGCATCLMRAAPIVVLVLDTESKRIMMRL